MKDKFIKFYMDVAEITSKLSYAKKLKVGTIAVKNNNIIGFSYNGTAPGDDNVCEHVLDTSINKSVLEYSYIKEGIFPYFNIDVPEKFKDWTYDNERNIYEKLKTKDNVSHAEENLINKLAKSNESIENAVIFCTHTPCLACARKLYAVNISKFYYKHEYRDIAGVQYLLDHNIPVIKI